jgi:hypothetical protein
MPPDHYLPIFEQSNLNDYDTETCECTSAPNNSFSNARNFPETSHAEVRGRERGGLFDAEDSKFYEKQEAQGFPKDAYSDTHFNGTTENPEKWLEIGVAYEGETASHATIITQDITSVNSNDTSSRFLFLAIHGRERKIFPKDALLRRLHLARLAEDGGKSHYDLSFEDLTDKRTFEKYYAVCRIRTTDRMIKYNARVSFPGSYKVLVSDCATFAHNFVLKTITRAHDDRLIHDAKFKAIKKNLVQHNTITVGTKGETEGLSLRSLVNRLELL